MPEELVLMAERYEKHKREKEMNDPREGRGGERWGRRDGGGRGGRDRGQDWRF